MKLKKISTTFPLFILILYFVFFTFYDLNWGAPFYFHPDERNIASSITQLNIFTNLNPHFFAYGSLPIYIVYLLGFAFNIFVNQKIVPIVDFDVAIIIGRLISATLTVILVGLTYKVTHLVSSKNSAILALVFSLTSVAYLQFSHYGTFEIWITFLSLLLIYFLLIYVKNQKNIYYVLACSLIGILTGLKLSSAVLFIVPLFLVIYQTFSQKLDFKNFLKLAKRVGILIYFPIFFYVLTSPFNILDKNDFIDSMKYEGSVAAGTLPVFYTGSFYNKIPIIFQFEKILPFLINPLLTILLIPAVIYFFFIVMRKKDISLAMILITFLGLFISGSILFAKWERYIVPSIPTLYIIIAIFSEKILSKLKKNIALGLVLGLTMICLLFSFSYIKTARIDPETQIAAASFAKKNIPHDSQILSEVYDLGVTPLNSSFQNITLFNFYDLDNNPNQEDLLKQQINDYDYLFIPSQRIYKPRILLSNKFPNGNKFYKNLFEGKTNYKMIYQTPCDIFCNLTYLGDPVFNVEETVDVFDRPTAYIFKKQ